MDDLSHASLAKMAKQLDDREYSIETGASYPRGRLFLDALADLLEDDDEETRTEDDEGDDVEKAQPEKEKPMDSIHSIMKTGGITATCAAIVAKGATSISEHELVEAATKVAAERHPELSPAQAFAKVYTAATDEARVLQNAIAIAKAMPVVADLTPVMVGGEDARDLSDESEAIANLKELGRRKWPTATEAQQFANAFSDPVNRELAQKAHRRPTPPAGGAYPFPR